MSRAAVERATQELRYAARGLARERGFFTTATLILAVGIGICTAMFSIVHAVLLRPLAIRNPDRLTMLWSLDTRDQTLGELSYSARRDLVEAMPSFEDLALVGSVNWSGTLRLPDATPVSLASSAVSGTFFDVLGATPLFGRTLTAQDDEPSAAPVIVLSHAAWTQYFGADPAIVGRKVPMGTANAPHLVEIAGVMPPDFFFPRGTQYWTPALPEIAKFAAQSGDSLQKFRDILGVFYGVGRLRPDADLAAANEEGRRFIQAEGRKHGVDLSSQRIQLTPLLDHVFGRARYALALLMAAVVMVLLIACGNVAGLIFARGAAQSREMAVRAALGASRSALARHLLIESGLVAVSGAVLGVAAATLVLDLLVGLSPADIPRLESTRIDGSVLMFAIACAVVTTLAVGLMPALRLSRPSLVDDIKSGATGLTRHSSSARTRRWLIGMQVAVTLVLLIAAGLCLRSFSSLNRQDLGFVSRNLLTFSIGGLDKERYPALEARRAAIDELIARFDRVPQVTRAAALLLRPFEHGPIGMDSGVLLEGQPDTTASSSTNPVVNWEWITDGYFETMRIPVIRGRVFGPSDTASALSVAVVSAATATRLWPGQDPIGKRLRLSASEDRWHTVVGVVGTARYRELDAPRFDLYVSVRQSDPDGPHFVVRTTGDPMTVIPALSARIADVDKGLALSSVITMDAIVRRVQGPWRFNMLVFGLFGGVAMGLAAVGLFALVACDVALRRREIGLRMALGARPGEVVRLMIWEGAKPSIVGVAAGLFMALAATRVLAEFLFDVAPTDPFTFASVVLVFMAVIVLASYVPARRAAAIDPQVVLRE